MYARKVSLHLKANTAAEFTKRLDNDVIPLLRKQKGFHDEITLMARDGKAAIGISLWDRQESAEAYDRGSYLKVVKMLEQVTSGQPHVETYEVSNSTLHRTLDPARD